MTNIRTRTYAQTDILRGIETRSAAWRRHSAVPLRRHGTVPDGSWVLPRCTRYAATTAAGLRIKHPQPAGLVSQDGAALVCPQTLWHAAVLAGAHGEQLPRRSAAYEAALLQRHAAHGAPVQNMGMDVAHTLCCLRSTLDTTTGGRVCVRGAYVPGLVDCMADACGIRLCPRPVAVIQASIAAVSCAGVSAPTASHVYTT